MTDAHNDPHIGVLVMAYGTPRTPAEIEPYYTDIRRGRPPTPEALADLTERYAAIGGVSPLAELTEAQAAAIEAHLDAAAKDAGQPGRFRVGLGLKHADPKVEEGAAALVAAGAEKLVGVVLAPHYSSYSIGQYLSRAQDGAGDVPVLGIESWATEPAFVRFLAADLATRFDALSEEHGPVHVLFTAHSLPQRIIDGGDPYPDELRATATAVAGELGLVEGDEWSIAWQSAGRTPEPWIGPDVLDAIDQLADDGAGAVIVSSCGFVADHLEVLYDLDIEAAQRAAARGLAFDRTASVNADPAVMTALAELVRTVADPQ